MVTDMETVVLITKEKNVSTNSSRWGLGSIVRRWTSDSVYFQTNLFSVHYNVWCMSLGVLKFKSCFCHVGLTANGTVSSFKWFHLAFDERVWKSIVTHTHTRQSPFCPHDITTHRSHRANHFLFRLAYICFSCPPQPLYPPLLTSPAAFMLWHQLRCVDAQSNMGSGLIS